jgi:hypothetical protein
VKERKNKAKGKGRKANGKNASVIPSEARNLALSRSAQIRARFLASLGMTGAFWVLPFALCLLTCSFGFAFCALRFAF